MLGRQMLEIVFSGKIDLSFYFPCNNKLSNLIVVTTEESDFNTRYCRSVNCVTQVKEKTGIRKFVVKQTCHSFKFYLNQQIFLLKFSEIQIN